MTLKGGGLAASGEARPSPRLEAFTCATDAFPASERVERFVAPVGDINSVEIDATAGGVAIRAHGP